MFKRKIYSKMQEWKKDSDGKTALLIEGASKFNVISTIKFADLKKAEIITDHLENKEFKRITNIEEVFS